MPYKGSKTLLSTVLHVSMGENSMPWSSVWQLLHTLQMTSPAQNGSTRIWDILVWPCPVGGRQPSLFMSVKDIRLPAVPSWVSPWPPGTHALSGRPRQWSPGSALRMPWLPRPGWGWPGRRSPGRSPPRRTPCMFYLPNAASAGTHMHTNNKSPTSFLQAHKRRGDISTGQDMSYSLFRAVQLLSVSVWFIDHKHSSVLLLSSCQSPDEWREELINCWNAHQLFLCKHSNTSWEQQQMFCGYFHPWVQFGLRTIIYVSFKAHNSSIYPWIKYILWSTIVSFVKYVLCPG